METPRMSIEIKTLESLTFPFCTEFTIALTDDWDVVVVNNSHIDIDINSCSDMDSMELEAIASDYGFECFEDMLVTVPSGVQDIDELWDFLDYL
jgi:hypothetical protein